MEFGFWKKNSWGELIYYSISGDLGVELLEDEEFWNIVQLDDWVLFQSLERIYIYNASDKSIKSIDASSIKAHMFNFNGTVYYHRIGIGLFKIENGISILIADDPIVKEDVILGIFSIDNRPLLVTEKGEFYFLNGGNLVRWHDPFSENNESIKVYSSLQLIDGTIVLGTISNGIYHIDSSGKVIHSINQKKGLNNNTVLAIFEDREHNLWLALDNGISILNMDSPFNEYIDKNGEIGVVYASTLYRDYLYLGTNQGLFYKQAESEGNFTKVKGTEGQVWLLKIVDNVLFCGHNSGTYVVNGTKAKLISKFPGTWDIKPIPNRKDLLLQGNFNGLSVLKKNGTEWQFRNSIEGFDISSRFFEFIGKNRIVVNREFKGLYKLYVDSDYTKIVGKENEPPKGIGASLVRYAEDVLYTCNNGIFKYDVTDAVFLPDTVLTYQFYGEKDDPIGIFIPDQRAKRLWCFTERNIVYTSPGKLDARSQISKIPIPAHVRKNLGVLGFESLIPIGNEKYLVGISNGYLTVDLTKLKSKEYTVRISSVARKSSDTPVERIYTDSTISFKSSQNNLFFSYHVPEFDKYTEVNYQYLLKGIYESWSEWSTVSEASFENLPYGNYSFKVRAKIGNLISSNVAGYDFRIERPWFLSNLAIFIYVLTFILLALSVHKLYKRYYVKQQELLLRANKKKIKRKKLKAQKRIVQIKNEKLQEEVESKNRELAISTMSIIKKNEFLNAIKDQLKDSTNIPQVKSVIRTIDRNINNSDDWKFFEDAFNHADKDFLKKVKSLHPELTANDLRLCTYLRLNLSSKEIAPLLNISVRSVEVKRYRLRKKMKLIHEDGLTDYILDI